MRLLSLALLALAPPALAGAPAVPEAPVLTARAECEPLLTAGRMRCVLEARLPDTATFQWFDAQIIASPLFVMPLRGRFSGDDAEVREEHLVRWGVAVVGKAEGEGELTLRVRAVACTDREKRMCVSVVADARARVKIGK